MKKHDLPEDSIVNLFPVHLPKPRTSTHKNIIPHECLVCKRPSTSKISFQRHFWIMHKDSEVGVESSFRKVLSLKKVAIRPILFSKYPLKWPLTLGLLGVFPPLRSDCTRLRNHRISWIVSECRVAVF